MAYDFKIGGHDDADKEFELITPYDGVKILVDWDDVDGNATDIVVREMVKCLNDHFPFAKVKKLIDASRLANE